jgi:DNA polymerase/3'-5' exonuclease PolX
MKVYELFYIIHNRKLQDFKQLKSCKNIPFINSAYKRVECVILKSHDLNSIITQNNINNLEISKCMKLKISNILLQKIKKSDLIQINKKYLHDQLIQIDGIGNGKASTLIKLGLKDISQLKLKKWRTYLTDATILWMNHKPLQKIPRKYITKMEPVLINDFAKTNLAKKHMVKIQIVGGYLRKKAYCKDIDIILVSNTLTITDYIDYLASKYKIVVYSKGDNKSSLLIHGIYKHYYKVDIFITPTKYQYAMLLYSTGSREFNIKIRKLAKEKGFLLNQKGLFDISKLHKLDKTVYIKSANPIKINSEKQIFEKLGMKYQLPENR